MLDQTGISHACYIVNCQACYIVKIYHSGLEPWNPRYICINKKHTYIQTYVHAVQTELQSHITAVWQEQREKKKGDCLFVGCLTSQQQASVSQGRICSDNLTCCHTEKEVADQTFYLTQSQYTDTGLTSPSADPITPGAWQGSHWSANF